MQFQKDSGALSSHGVHEDALMNSEAANPKGYIEDVRMPTRDEGNVCSFIFKRGWDTAKTRGSVQSKKDGE